MPQLDYRAESRAGSVTPQSVHRPQDIDSKKGITDQSRVNQMALNSRIGATRRTNPGLDAVAEPRRTAIFA